MILGLNALRDEANRWLLEQRTDRALSPSAIAHFRSHFCLPWWLVEAIRRDEERDTQDAQPREVQ